MRTNNEKVKNIIISVYFILIVLTILFAVFFSAFRNLTNSPVLTLLIITLSLGTLIYVVHHISKYFEYDSDGVKVIVTNKGLLLSDYFNYREHTIEFDKERLSGFKFKNFVVYKSLVLYINDKHGNVKKEHFNVTLVAKKKRKYIKQSLSKIVKQNSKDT